MVDHVMVPVDVSSTLEYVYVEVSSNVLNIPVTVGNAIIVNGGGGEHYGGPYEVLPLAFSETVLETKDLVMDDDVTVLKIPYYETSNLSGGYTVYIAGEV